MTLAPIGAVLNLLGKGKNSGEGSERSKRLADSSDVLVALPDALKKRMESVIAYTYPHTGINQQSVFIRAAIAKSCAELEARFNNGDPWPETQSERPSDQAIQLPSRYQR